MQLPVDRVALVALSVVALTAVHGAAGQAVPAAKSEWWSRRFSAEGVGLAVAVGVPGRGCQAAIVTGYANDKVYAVTAATPLLSVPPPGQRAVVIGRVQGVMVTGGPRVWEYMESRSARVLRQDAQLVVLEIVDEHFARWAARLEYAILGDPSRLVRRDSVYTLGCQLGMPLPPGLTLLAQVTDKTMTFQGYPPFTPEPWGADPFIGGEVIQAFGAIPLLVGMVTDQGTRTEARHIGDVIRQLQDWGVPVMLRASGTRPDCRYRAAPVASVSELGVDLGAAAGQRANISVEADGSCAWTAFADSAPWIRITATSGDTRVEGWQKGPGTVVIETTERNACGQSPRRSAVMVAGRVFHVEQASC